MARRFHDLADLQREDAAEAEAAHWALRGRGFWHLMRLWTRRLGRVAKWLKELGAIVVAGTTLIGGGIRLYQLMRARTVAPPEQLATGVPSTALDRVEPPKLPKSPLIKP